MDEEKKLEDFEAARELAERLYQENGEEPANGAAQPIPAETLNNEQPVAEEAAPAADNGSGDTTTNAPEQQEQGQMIEEAVSTAETAAAAAAERTQEVMALQQQMRELAQQNQQLQQTLQQMSEQQKEAALEKTLEPPKIDLSDLAFVDEAEAARRQAQYANDMAEYAKEKIMQQMQPMLDQAKRMQEENERTQALGDLEKVPELKGIGNRKQQLDRIISVNPALKDSDIPWEEKYITAYAMARGIDAMNAPEPKEMSVDELFEKYRNNPEFQAMVEKERIEKVKNAQQVPPFSASSGAGNAALDIKEKPKTFEEASERVRALFGQ